MAIVKNDVISLGRGALTDNSNAAIVFTSNMFISTWINSTTYAQYNCLEYSGNMYRSKISSNTGNQPDTSPSQWEVLYRGVKDGDVAFIVNGAGSTVNQRVSGIWGGVSTAPITLSLNDGQITSADAFVFIGSSKSFSQIEYTLQRTAGQGRKRAGTMNILNDNFFSLSYDHSFTDIGPEVNAWLIPVIISGNVHMQYTSASESIDLTLQYTLKGW